MADESADLLQGTLELLLLKTLSLEPMHGWGITLRLEQMTQHALRVNQGSLYPALERLKRRGWIKSEWRTTENNRRARYYEITRAGRKELAAQTEAWSRSSLMVNRVLAFEGGTS